MLESSGDDDVSLGIDEAEIAGAEIAGLGEGGGCEGRVELAAADVRSAHAQLAGFTAGGDGSVAADGA